MTAAINSIHNVVDEKPTAEELSIYVNSMNPANRHHNSSLIFQWNLFFKIIILRADILGMSHQEEKREK